MYTPFDRCDWKLKLLLACVYINLIISDFKERVQRNTTLTAGIQEAFSFTALH